MFVFNVRVMAMDILTHSSVFWVFRNNQNDSTTKFIRVLTTDKTGS